MARVGIGIALVGALIVAPAAAAPARSALSSTCGDLPVPPTTWSHVIWIWMENKSYDSIVGSVDAPYTNALIAQCGLATNYHNISHPSLRNYIAATSGLGYRNLKPFPDCLPTGTCVTAAASIFAVAPTWKAYEESMPFNCWTSNAGLYAVRHNPPPYYSSLSTCPSFDVPYSQLQSDLDADTLPAFSFITPNLCDDTHTCPTGVGDAWLQGAITAITASAAYQAGTTAVFVTWDEGEGGTARHCAANTTDVGCHVAAIVISPSTLAGSTSATLFNHYSLLRTTQEMLSISPLLGKAAKAQSMRSAFNL